MTLSRGWGEGGSEEGERSSWPKTEKNVPSADKQSAFFPLSNLLLTVRENLQLFCFIVT